MTATPAFLDTNRPDVPDIVVPRGVTPFHLPNRPVRGRLIRLGALAHALLGRHENTPEVTRLAGEALALAAGLSSALKYRGSFSLQAKGDGPVSMLLADCTQEGALRGYARADREKLAALLEATPAPSAAALLGQGYLAFTVDQGGDMDRYQGIVSIEGDSLREMALHYFRTSEQLQYDLHLAAAQTPDGWRAGALILERVAGEGGIDPELDEAAQDEAWRTAKTLAATLTDAELLDDSLLPERLVWRLFGAEGVAVDRPRALAYGCRCSRAKLSGILESFPGDDLDEMVVDGDIVMTCEFCKYDFRFARADVHSQVGAQGPQASQARLGSRPCCCRWRSPGAARTTRRRWRTASRPCTTNTLPKLRLNVANIQVVDHSLPVGPQDVASSSPVVPAQALAADGARPAVRRRQRRRRQLRYRPGQHRARAERGAGRPARRASRSDRRGWRADRLRRGPCGPPACARFGSGGRIGQSLRADQADDGRDERGAGIPGPPLAQAFRGRGRRHPRTGRGPAAGRPRRCADSDACPATAAAAARRTGSWAWPPLCRTATRTRPCRRCRSRSRCRHNRASCKRRRGAPAFPDFDPRPEWPDRRGIPV